MLSRSFGQPSLSQQRPTYPKIPTELRTSFSDLPQPVRLGTCRRSCAKSSSATKLFSSSLQPAKEIPEVRPTYPKTPAELRTSFNDLAQAKGLVLSLLHQLNFKCNILISNKINYSIKTHRNDLCIFWFNQ